MTNGGVKKKKERKKPVLPKSGIAPFAIQSELHLQDEVGWFLFFLVSASQKLALEHSDLAVQQLLFYHSWFIQERNSMVSITINKTVSYILDQLFIHVMDYLQKKLVPVITFSLAATVDH